MFVLDPDMGTNVCYMIVNVKIKKTVVLKMKENNLVEGGINFSVIVAFS
jgi:hypothetical protein